MQALIVYMRFGSLTTPGPPLRTYEQIFKRTGVKVSTQHNIIARWTHNGYKIESHRSYCGRKQRLTLAQQLHVTCDATLKAQAHLTLTQRAHASKRSIGLPTSAIATLRSCYRTME